MPTTATHLWQPSSARCVVLDDFVAVPRGTTPALPGALVWPAKDPGDVLDYEFDISAAFLGDLDSIATIDVALTPNDGNLTMKSANADGSIVVLWFSGGAAGTTYAVQISVGTANGRTVGRAVMLPVQALAAITSPAASLSATSGEIITDQYGNPILIGS